MKRILSVLLMLVMVMGLLSVGALADGDPTIRVNSMEAEPGETITVEVSFENNPGIMAFVLGVEYDETRLEKVKFSHTGLQGLWAMSENAVWVGNEDDTYEGVFLKLKFRVLDDAPAGEAPVTITYSEGDICNYDEEDVSFAVVAGGVTVPGEGGEAAPEATEVPEATDKPEATEKPEATKAPEATDKPETTDRPESTKSPETTDVPEDEAEPAEGEDEPAPEVPMEEVEPVAAAEADEAAEPAEATEADVQVSEITAEASFTAPALASNAGTAESAPSLILLLIIALAVVAVILIVIIIVIIAKKNSYHGRH